jgi:four helix bundle protein
MQYDLGERTARFAKQVRELVRQLPRTITNYEDVKQLVRSSGSVGANYIEAGECLSRKDFLMRIKISRKEAKESGYWLNLLDTGSKEELDKERLKLWDEANQLTKIFGAIVEKSG